LRWGGERVFNFQKSTSSPSSVRGTLGGRGTAGGKTHARPSSSQAPGKRRIFQTENAETRGAVRGRSDLRGKLRLSKQQQKFEKKMSDQKMIPKPPPVGNAEREMSGTERGEKGGTRKGVLFDNLKLT